MQAGVGLLVTDVMPIYMIMPRYSHNYLLSYHLLDSNSFTHRNTYAIITVTGLQNMLIMVTVYILVVIIRYLAHDTSPYFVDDTDGLCI